MVAWYLRDCGRGQAPLDLSRKASASSGSMPAAILNSVAIFLAVLIAVPAPLWAQSASDDDWDESIVDSVETDTGAPGVGDSVNVDGVQLLYEEALYEDALNQLAPGCITSTDIPRCERLHALVLVAIGESDKARMAFLRMLLAAPNANPGDELSPKVRRLFDEARDMAQPLLEAKLQVAGEIKPKQDVLLEVRSPDLGYALGLQVTAISLWVAEPGTLDFDSLTMMLRGQVWSARWIPSEFPKQAGSLDTPYFMVIELSDGNQVNIGSQAAPRLVSTPWAAASGDAGTEDDDHDDEPVDEDAVDIFGNPTGEPEPLPTWAKYTLMGTGGAVVLGGLIWGAVAIFSSSTGDLRVNVEVIHE